MQDIKPIRKRKPTENTILRDSNIINNLIKKILISILLLTFIGIVVFFFIQDEKYSNSKIKINNATENKTIEETSSQTKELTNKIETIETDETIKDTENSSKLSSSKLSIEAEDIIKDKTQKSINAIQNKDFTMLASLIHPEHNIIFSPYANFNENNKSFSQSEIKNILNSSTTYNWGNYNGIFTEPIKMKFSDYYDLFVYDQNYSNAEKISYNKNISTGKIKNNAQDFFPNSIIVEYHFSGFDPELKAKGMDWRSLRLVFIEIDGEWYLKGISHDEPTI